MLDLYDELEAVLLALRTAGVPHALCSGLAMAVYGQPRATIDIDLLVPADSVDAALAVLRSVGFEIAALLTTFAGGAVQIHRASKVDAEAGDLLSVDLLVVTPALNAVWESRRVIDWGTTSLTVVSRQGLITLKELRGSGQDRDDIQALRGIDEG